ncbi:MAG: hypothetical protein RL265_885 [Bacteroidota bacterium]|jgi:hypothetical protein
MKQDIQTTLFQLIKQKNAGEDSLGNVLSDVLSISSDAVYRRLRNETALTIQEVKKLCVHYNISFDALCATGDGKVVFSYPPLATFDFSLESYLEGILQAFHKLKQLSGGEIILSVNNIQFFQLLNFPQLMRFKLYFWAKTHLQMEEYKDQQFKHEKTSDTAFSLGMEILQIYNSIPSKEIYDPEFMRGFLRQIHYYYTSHLFEDPSYALFLHDRILLLSSHLEAQANCGKKFMYGTQAPANGNNFEMYLNETINSDATFYYKGKELQGVYLTHNLMNYLETTDENYVNDSKLIIDKQLANSSLISLVNEKERNNFFFEFNKTINSFKKKMEADF